MLYELLVGQTPFNAKEMMKGESVLMHCDKSSGKRNRYALKDQAQHDARRSSTPR